MMRAGNTELGTPTRGGFSPKRETCRHSIAMWKSKWRMMIDPFSPQFCVHIVWLTNLENFGRQIAQEQSESRYLLKLDFLDIIGIVQEAQEAIPPWRG